MKPPLTPKAALAKLCQSPKATQGTGGELREPCTCRNSSSPGVQRSCLVCKGWDRVWFQSNEQPPRNGLGCVGLQKGEPHGRDPNVGHTSEKNASFHRQKVFFPCSGHSESNFLPRKKLDKYKCWVSPETLRY